MVTIGISMTIKYLFNEFIKLILSLNIDAKPILHLQLFI